MRCGIVTFPGSNCDHDLYWVLRHRLGVDTRFLWHKETSLDSCDVIFLPGGFSYGDYLRTGAIANVSPVMDSVRAHAAAGGFVVGICNGFQILVESGLLPGVLLRNRDLRFICEYRYLRVENNRTPFTSRYKVGEVIRVPLAHNEGCYYDSPERLEALRQQDLVIFRYCDAEGNVTLEANPNGAMDNIAGIMSPRGNVLGLMPHPERCSDPLLQFEDGFRFFESLLDHIGR